MSRINYTFIITLYNKDNNLLKRCIDSIPKRYDIEIIIIDDHTPSYYDKDGKQKSDLISALPFYGSSGVIYYFLPNNGGPGIARNFGIEKARGEWILFLDADDYYESSLLNELLVFSTTTSSELILFAYNYRTPSETNVKMYGYKNENNEVFHVLKQEEEIKFITIMYPWARMIKKSLIMRTGARFDNLYLSEDRLFCVNTFLAAKKKIFFTKPVYNYIYDSNSLVNKVHSKKELMSAINVAIDVNRVYQNNGFLGYIYDDTVWGYLAELYKLSSFYYWFLLLKVLIVLDLRTFIIVRKMVCYKRNVHNNLLRQWRVFFSHINS